MYTRDEPWENSFPVPCLLEYMASCMPHFYHLFILNQCTLKILSVFCSFVFSADLSPINSDDSDNEEESISVNL